MGLTAPTFRIALVLLSIAGPNGGFSIDKPRMERLTGIRMDNARRHLERVRTATFDYGDEAAPVFSDLDYTAGVQKRLAGIISGRLSPQMVEAISNPIWAGKRIGVDFEEMKKLSTLPGLLLWLRLAVERSDGKDEFRLRLKPEDAAEMFGQYLSRATVRKKDRDGDEYMWTALSRIYSIMIEPAVKDLWNALDEHVVDATPVTPPGGGKGKAWHYVDLKFARVQRQMSIRELAQSVRDHEEYQRTKFDNPDL
ncbi:hypothetical protein GCM10007989_25480 [Devosia pacifica]|uniref:Uncharacterized protein n=2 Tax=Devosia pacifica TaxID=1335967 RepID=A0A918VVZ9_9HYPH|nr:hypothetical protein GCM10007989_25480 [Devosia pacifica]